MTHNDIIDKLIEIRPGAHWTFSGAAYEGLIWLDAPETKPTPAELGL